jgi:hypothetical protein
LISSEILCIFRHGFPHFSSDTDMNALNLNVFRAGGATWNSLRNHGFGGRVQAGNQPIMRAQEDLRAASSALAEALKSFKRETRPVYT